MGRKMGGAVPFSGGAGSPSNTKSPGTRPTSIPSGILVHPAVWPQQTAAKNWVGAVPFFLGGSWVPIEHKVAWAEAYLRTKKHLDASSHYSKNLRWIVMRPVPTIPSPTFHTFASSVNVLSSAASLNILPLTICSRCRSQPIDLFTQLKQLSCPSTTTLSAPFGEGSGVPI